MKIVVDAMGGDLAPQINIDGSVDALREFSDLEIVLVGSEADVRKSLEKYADQTALKSVENRLTIVNAPEVITPEEHPAMAIRKKKNSTFNIGMDLVRRKEAQAFVSAGSTGALSFGAMTRIGRIKGIQRPAIATLLPVPGRQLMLVDAGANTDCHPDWLAQFALMGSIYMKQVTGVKDPQVGLLNIGTESTKGNDLVQKTYSILSKEGQPFHFCGNIESRDTLAGKCDVLVADGFVGNILLKNIEGTVSTLFHMLKSGLMSSTKGKIAGLLAKDTFKQLKSGFDATEVGGAPLLGIEGAVIKAHGNSNARAIFCAIRQAKKMVDTGVVDNIRNEVGKMVQEETTQTENV